MDFLRLLESIRTPFWDAFFGTLTHLGSEVLFIAIIVFIYWCVSKRTAYYTMFVGFCGITLNQFMKITFRIPRPWVLDPNFHPVESAIADAGGYSFPSGHTQNIVGTVGVFATSAKRLWVKIVCIVIAILVPFSRMYLGVHTPLDVGVAAAIAILFLAVFYPLMKKIDKSPNLLPWFFGAMCLLAFGFVLYMHLQSFPKNTDPDNLANAIKNAHLIFGAAVGIGAGIVLDLKRLHFSVKAPFWGQVLKTVLGFALLMLLRAVIKEPLYALFGGSEWATTVRYLLVGLFASCVWPLTFPFFSKIGKKKEAK